MRVLSSIFFVIMMIYVPLELQAQMGDSDATRQAFVDKINHFRSTVGLPPLHRWMDGEACADRSAQADANANYPHQSMGSCGEMAQNTLPGYPSLEVALSTGLNQMWQEGPPPQEPCTGDCYMRHGHYINMTRKDFSKVAVGIYRMPDGKYWINMNFR